MHYQEFIASLAQAHCPPGLDPCLEALWHDAKGGWSEAHRIVQDIDTRMAARIHACLHREEGDEWNARYWHRQAGTHFPAGMSLANEWDELVRTLTAL